MTTCNSVLQRSGGDDQSGTVTDIPKDELLKLSCTSFSVKNFAVMCMRKMFCGEERENATVSGQRGKRKLDPSAHRLRKIYNYTMTMYSVPVNQRENVWEECITAINAANKYWELSKKN